MEHTYLAKKFTYEIPEQDKEACMETLDNFISKYAPNANSLYDLPSDLFRVFMLLINLYKNPNKKIKEDITIDEIVDTFGQRFKIFEEKHQYSGRRSFSEEIIYRDDLSFFKKNMVNYFLEDC